MRKQLWIKIGRVALGWRQSDLAEVIGVHRVTVSQWERGDKRVPKPMRLLLAYVFADPKFKKTT